MSRITDYTELTSPGATDVLPIVDVSDPTQSPDGTTKKITIDNLIAGQTLVLSVNNQTGDVTLDATAVGADPAGSAATAQSAAETYAAAQATAAQNAAESYAAGLVAGAPTDLFNVKSYGAVGNNIADDTAAINAAIAAAGAAAGGGIVYCPAGTYRTTGGHVLPLNVSVIGEGKTTTTFNHRGVSTYCFFAGSLTGGPNPPNCMGRLAGFTVSGQSGGNGTGSFGTQIGIKILNCLFFHVQDVHFTLLYEGLLIDGGDETALGSGTFAGNGYVANVTSSNIYIGLHVYRWVTDTTYLFCYGYGNSPITSGSVGAWFDTKPATSTMVNPSYEGFDTGYLISTSSSGLCFMNPRVENCNTLVSYQNGTTGHTVFGGNHPTNWTASAAVVYANPAPAATTSTAGLVALDGTASDIQATGTQSAGSTGKAADAGHVHPAAFWVPSDSGLLVANMDPMSAGSSQLMVAGTLYLLKLYIRSAITITNLLWSISTAGSGSSTGSFTGLYSSGGTLLSGSSDIGTTITTGGTRTLALTTPQALTAGSFVWAAILVNLATSQPTMSKSGNSSTVANFNLSASAFRVAVNGTGLTSLPATITPASNSPTGSFAFFVGAT